MKPKLYQYAACPFCSKVVSALNYKNIDYETIEVDPLKKTEIAFSPDYRKVPIYIDSNGKQVNDSNAILKHLDDEFPDVTIFSKDPIEAEREKTWLDWSEKFVQGLPTLIYDNLWNSIQAFDYVTKTGNFSWLQKRMIKYSGAFIMTLVAKKIKKREQIEDPTEFIRQMTQEWADGLKGQDFMGGTKANVADIAVFGISRAVGSLNAGEIFKANAIYWAWLGRMQKETGLTLSVV